MALPKLSEPSLRKLLCSGLCNPAGLAADSSFPASFLLSRVSGKKAASEKREMMQENVASYREPKVQGLSLNHFKI